MIWKGKKVLVSGSEGMIGKELVIQLKDLGAHILELDYKKGYDLRNYNLCLEACLGEDYVFHLAGIKGNPKMTKEKPVSFMGPMLQFDTNMIMAAQRGGIKKFLYTSSIAVENPNTDKYPAWAKKTAETLIEAMRIQYPEGTKYCIVRPSNVYGKFDDFNREYPMVVTNLIKNTLKYDFVRLYNNGDDIRDFINAKDVARGMIYAMEKMPENPVNLCSGEGVKIFDIAKIIGKELNKDLITGPPTKPTERVMKLNWDFQPEIDIETGIKEVIEWNLKH